MSNSSSKSAWESVECDGLSLTFSFFQPQFSHTSTDSTPTQTWDRHVELFISLLFVFIHERFSRSRDAICSWTFFKNLPHILHHFSVITPSRFLCEKWNEILSHSQFFLFRSLTNFIWFEWIRADGVRDTELCMWSSWNFCFVEWGWKVEIDRHSSRSSSREQEREKMKWG